MKNTFNVLEAARRAAARRAAVIALLAVIVLFSVSCEVGENLVSNGNVAVTGVSLIKSNLILAVGGTEALSFTISPFNASNNSVICGSSIPAIASVTPGGIVTGLAVGTSFITITTVDGGKTAYCVVTVVQGGGGVVAVTGITLNKTSTTLAIGGTEALNAAVAPANATNQNVTWSSSAPAVASVSAGGVVSGISVGTATISVITADGNKTATCDVTVVQSGGGGVAVTGIALNKMATTLSIGSAENLTAIISPSDATNQNVTWSSSNASVAQVANGVVIGVSVGTAAITATTVDGGKTATCTVTISSVTVAVTSVTLKTSAAILVGGIETLSAVIVPSNATNQNVTWSSSNALIASVSTGGVVSGVAVGTAAITATTADGGKTATCTVNVNAAGAISNVTFNGVTADGTTTQTTTLLALTFSQAITGLSANDITLSGVAGVIKGNLSGSGPTYSLPISGFTAGGTLTVVVASPPGYSVSDSSKTAAIYYYNNSENQTPTAADYDIGNLTQNAGSVTAVTITPKAGKSTGAITILYNGTTTLPTTAGTYTVTFNVAVITGWNAASGLAAGTLTLSSVPPGSATLTITFAQINDAAPSITGPTIYISSSNGPTSKDITLDNASQYDSGSIKWYITGTSVTGTGSSFTLNTAGTIYSKVGQHFLTVEVMKGGIPFNKTIVFTVAN